MTQYSGENETKIVNYKWMSKLLPLLLFLLFFSCFLKNITLKL